MRRQVTFKSTVAIITTQRSEHYLKKYAQIFAGRHEIRVVTADLPDFMADSFVPDATPRGDPSSINNVICHTAKLGRVHLLLSEWLHHPNSQQDLLWLAHKLDVPAVFIRHPHVTPAGRVVVATEGGKSVLEQLWVAREIACAYDAPIHLLRVVLPSSPKDDSENPTAALQVCASHLKGMHVQMEARPASNVIEGVVGSLDKDDLLVLGAPSALRVNVPFAGSLPDVVARRIQGPLVLLSTPPGVSGSFSGVFRGNLSASGRAKK